MLYHMGRCYYPYFIILADVIALFIIVAVGMTLHYMFSFDNGRCYYHVARVEQPLLYWKMADVITMWQDGIATM